MSPHKPVRKAVLPAAGLGTRFLPATKAQPKEMLPVVDKPLIQYAVEECVASGIESIIIVTGRGKNAIEDHFDAAPELEQFLEKKGDEARAELVRRISNMVRFSYTRQKEPLGLGHAVLMARDIVGDEPFAVLLADVILVGPDPPTRQLAEIYEATGLGAIAVAPVPPEQAHLYGIVDARPANEQGREGWLRVYDLVEKPKAEEAPSNLAVTGRYVLPPEIFDYLERTSPDQHGEIQLTNALCQLAREKGLLARICDAKAHDAGNKLGFLQATVEIALDNPDLGEAFRAYLRALKL